MKFRGGSLTSLMRGVVQQLPAPHRDPLLCLLRHLRRVADLSSVNKMAASNLGIVFGPTLMMPPPTMTMDVIARNMGQQNLIVQNLITNLHDISLDNQMIFDANVAF